MEQKLAQLQAKIAADGSFLEKLFSLETPEEVQSLMKEAGIEFTLEEIDGLRKALVKTAEKGELADEDLEGVAGGFAVTTGIAAVSATITAANFTHNVTRGRW
ncbi:MAG: Nif11-like leader peptide family natural product precursor [Syntrophomonadaceae bacterium]|jgi:predicted ribosomally synthesized peptide with nif11-like leader|nr:Nif11-like leader peptide family natural product precursor [Syntrophomonadaceae bacterium]